MEYTQQQLKEKFDSLPNDIRQALLSEDPGLIIQLIGQDAGITPEQALDIEDEVTAVLMGTSHPKDFIANIQSKIDVDQEKARAIAEKVNEEIFQPVKESLNVVHNITGEASPASLASGASTDLGSIPTPPVPPRPTANGFPQMIVPPKMDVEIISPPPTPQGASLASLASEASIASMQKALETPKPPQNIFEQKLQGVFKMPKEETLVPPKSSPPQPPQPPRPGGVDPYRESPR